MNILFMGTPKFAAASLEALIGAGMNVCAAVTQPDKPKGRGHKLAAPEVKLLAQENGIPVFQPKSLKNGELEDTLKSFNPDMIVVAAYGKILPKYVLEYPKYGCINVHGSLLPKYRGAAPVQRAVIDGETETGITVMQMDEGLDTGDILSVKKTEIGEYETSGELFERLAVIGGELLVKTILDIESGAAVPKKQDSAKATYAHMIAKEDALIDWSKSMNEISCLIRGMNPSPMAYTYYEGTPVKILSAEKINENASGSCGEILGLVKKRGLYVKCADGIICVKTAKFPGGKAMNIEDYMRGHEIKTGAVLT